MNDSLKFLSTFFGMLTDAASLAWEHLVDYKNFLWRLTKRFALFAAIPIPILLVCLIFGWPVNWLYSAYFIFVGAEAVILMVLAFPIIAAAQIIFDKFPQFAGSIRKSVQLIAAVAFWALMLAVYFYVFPVWENPRMIPLVLMSAAALTLGAYAGWVHLPRAFVKRTATVFLVGIFVIATFAFSFPNRTRQLFGSVQKFDEAAYTKPIKIDSLDQIAFVDPKGKSQIWYYRSPTGEYELFDHEGFHRSGARLKLAETAEERNQIITWFRDQLQRKAQEQDRQKRETSQSYVTSSEATADLKQNARAPRLTPPQMIGNKAEEEAIRQKLMLATVPGTSYIGVISHDDERQRIRLVFTEQNGFLLGAEVNNPDNRNQKLTFTGEMSFEPKPERNSPVAYSIVMSAVSGQGKESFLGGESGFAYFYAHPAALKLRPTDTGLEGESDTGFMAGNFTIRLQREDASSVEQRKAEEEANRQKLMLATAPGARYIGTISYNKDVQHIRLVFTEQKDFLISAVVSNPNKFTQKQTFTGEMDFNPNTQRMSPVVSYNIVMSSLSDETFRYHENDFDAFYMRDVSFT